MPAELKVLDWRKGERRGMVVCASLAAVLGASVMVVSGIAVAVPTELGGRGQHLRVLR